jgi:FKBP-type peptidyl-prolyl cis-trans isomerase
MRFVILCALLAVAFVATAGAREGEKPQKKELKIEDLVVGKGRFAAADNRVTVHYTGWLEDGRKFDSSRDRGRPVSFRLGQGEVIRGWDRGILGMRVGGKRRLTVPPDLGYGKRGAGDGAVPPNATLVFEIELLRVE